MASEQAADAGAGGVAGPGAGPMETLQIAVTRERALSAPESPTWWTEEERARVAAAYDLAGDASGDGAHGDIGVDGSDADAFAMGDADGRGWKSEDDVVGTAEDGDDPLPDFDAMSAEERQSAMLAAMLVLRLSFGGEEEAAESVEARAEAEERRVVRKAAQLRGKKGRSKTKRGATLTRQLQTTHQPKRPKQRNTMIKQCARR